MLPYYQSIFKKIKQFRIKNYRKDILERLEIIEIGILYYY